jgi:ArsR family transcriptional regulator, zinc-responsive transcriptional repressor
MTGKSRVRNMVKRMSHFTDARVSSTAGGTVTGASANSGRTHEHDPLDDPLSPRSRGPRDGRALDRHDLDEHSHDLGLAVVGLENGAASSAGQTSPPAVRTEGPPAAIATFEAAGELLRALAAPVRIAIVVRLGDGPQCVHDLVESTGAPQPLISQHLRVLRGAGVVRGVRRGREIAYSLTDEHIGHILADAINHAREAR